jgi:hypothetical protein
VDAANLGDTSSTSSSTPSSIVAEKQKEQAEAVERHSKAVDEQRHRQLTDLVCEEVFTVEHLCSAAWDGGQLDRFKRMLNFLSVDEINKTNSRGQTALVRKLFFSVLTC